MFGHFYRSAGVMDHMKGRVAVVTGASAGIGAALVAKLVEAGLVVVGMARRLHRLQVISLTVEVWLNLLGRLS